MTAVLIQYEDFWLRQDSVSQTEHLLLSGRNVCTTLSSGPTRVYEEQSIVSLAGFLGRSFPLASSLISEAHYRYVRFAVDEIRGRLTHIRKSREKRVLAGLAKL